MVGKVSSARVGEVVSGRAEASPIHPAPGPVMEKGFLKVVALTWRTEAIARMGEMSFSERITVVSVSSGTR